MVNKVNDKIIQQKSETSPHEGVFWVINQNGTVGKSSNIKLLYDFCGHEGHSSVWQKLQQKHKELAYFDYEHFPRGRVWKNADKSVIFIPECLNTLLIINKINAMFELQNNFTVEIY